MSKALYGLDIGDLRVAPKDAIKAAASLSFDAVEIPVAGGELAPEALSPSGRRHLARFVAGAGLSLAALRADFPRLRLSDPASVDQRVDRTSRIIEMARETQTPVVSMGVGALTDPRTGKPFDCAIEAISRFAEVAESRSVRLALRPSADTGEQIGEIVRAVGCSALKVCWDPAAMVMHGLNPLESVERYADQIELFHARDAVSGRSDRPGYETGLGEGEVDLLGALEFLRDLEYGGPYVLRRNDSNHPVDDLLSARDVLSRELRRA